MSEIYAPVMRALVVAALMLATATLMFVAVNTAKAAQDRLAKCQSGGCENVIFSAAIRDNSKS
jgi:hypothetical protein